MTVNRSICRTFISPCASRSHGHQVLVTPRTNILYTSLVTLRTPQPNITEQYKKQWWWKGIKTRPLSGSRVSLIVRYIYHPTLSPTLPLFRFTFGSFINYAENSTRDWLDSPNPRPPKGDGEEGCEGRMVEGKASLAAGLKSPKGRCKGYCMSGVNVSMWQGGELCLPTKRG